MSYVARYIIVLDRYDDDDFVPEDADAQGKEQVAAELQEAMNTIGQPAGFFRVVARQVIPIMGEHINISRGDLPNKDAHRAAMRTLDETRTY